MLTIILATTLVVLLCALVLYRAQRRKLDQDLNSMIATLDDTLRVAKKGKA